jgi:hypothetical protein
MNELFDFAFSPPVIGYTIFLMVFLLYWLTVIIGIFDFSSLDFDIDIDADIDMDVDVDVDADTDIDASGGGSIVLAILGFFNFGKVPFMVVMSILALGLWTVAILTNYYFSNGSIWFSIFLLIPNLFVSLLIAKIVTTPLIPLFDSIARDEAKQIDYIGLLGELVLETSNTSTGQIEIKYEKRLITLSVKAVEEQEGMIKRGTEVVIAYYDEAEELFYVRPVRF